MLVILAQLTLDLQTCNAKCYFGAEERLRGCVELTRCGVRELGRMPQYGVMASSSRQPDQIAVSTMRERHISRRLHVKEKATLNQTLLRTTPVFNKPSIARS